MTTFLRLLRDKDKEEALKAVISAQRSAINNGRCFEVDPDSFCQIPGAPFAYWVSDAVRKTFRRMPPFEGEGRTVRVGLQTSDDFRFVRVWWEVNSGQCLVASGQKWFPFAKGGAYSPYYADVYLVVNWAHGGAEIISFVDPKTGKQNSRPQNTEYYLRLGLTWPLRAHCFAPQAMPSGCIFSVRGYSAFPKQGDELATLAIFNSAAFDYLFKIALGRFGYPEFIVGILQIMPWAKRNMGHSLSFSKLAHRAWSLKRTLDTVTETSHAFLLPTALRPRLGDYDPPVIEAKLARIQAEIDDIAFNLYGFSETDRLAVLGGKAEPEAEEAPAEDAEDKNNEAADTMDSLLSWAMSVAFGRFDWRLATGEREPPSEPDPFDPLPAKSPGMLPDGVEPFHAHSGILVDDPGHPHDLAHLVEEVLERVDMPVPNDVRRWLQRDFFPFHLKQYSKSRRKAPVYWPLSTTSDNYTLWIYYPHLTSQTFYIAINDFLEPKLKQVGGETTALRNKGTARTREEEKQFEELQSIELELIEFRDTLLKIAQHYHPNHDDGVQITASPLWPLFRHKPWQKVLKDTWKKLEKGDYDWAHLAMNYWPERVREKCRTDKSLAIAHGLEELYEEPPEQPKKKRRREKAR